MKMTYSAHCEKRASQRGISKKRIECCVKYGRVGHSMKAMFYFIGNKEIKQFSKYDKDIINYNGTVVIVENGVIETTFINKNFSKNFKWN